MEILPILTENVLGIVYYKFFPKPSSNIKHCSKVAVNKLIYIMCVLSRKTCNSCL